MFGKKQIKPLAKFNFAADDVFFSKFHEIFFNEFLIFVVKGITLGNCTNQTFHIFAAKICIFNSKQMMQNDTKILLITRLSLHKY